MESTEVPDDVSAFLAQHIGSVVQLEVLLFCHARADLICRGPEIARDLRIDPAWTEAVLGELASAGLLAHKADEGGYRYAPRTQQLSETVGRLAELYSTHRVTIVSMIFAKPPIAIQKFSDAFRFRKEPGT